MSPSELDTPISAIYDLRAHANSVVLINGGEEVISNKKTDLVEDIFILHENHPFINFNAKEFV